MALEAESSNLSRHPTKDRTVIHAARSFLYNGPSPSGKAEDFDSSIRRFKSGRPNQIPPENDAAKLVCGVLLGDFFVARRELCGAALKAGWQTRGMRVSATVGSITNPCRTDRDFFEQKSTF